MIVAHPYAKAGTATDCSNFAANQVPTGTKVHTLQFQGLERVQEKTVLRFLESRADEDLEIEQLQQDMERLQDLGIFSKIRCSLSIADQKAQVLFELEEKWTTIPILKLASGGGVSQQTIGLFDPNVAGQGRELGGQLEKLGEAISSVIWAKDPAFVLPQYSLFVQAWSVHRLRTKYEQNVEEPTIKTGFFQSRIKYQIDLGYEWHRNWKSTLILEYNRDNFSDQYLSAELKEKLSTTGLPPNTEALIAGISNRWGRVVPNQSLFVGHEIEHSVRRYNLNGGESHDFLQNELRYRGFVPLFNQTALALQFRLGVSDTKILQYWYYLGGLDSIRGFKDNRFAGRNYWLTNLEIRHHVLAHPSLQLQFVPFIDSVGVAEQVQGLDQADGMSAGLGLRFIFPKIYRLVLRIDRAKPIKSNDTENIAFGVQHFF